MIGRAIEQTAQAASRTLHSIRWTPAVRSARDLRVVLYHGIGDNSRPWLSSLDDEITADTFARQLDYLQTHYEIVPLEDGIARVQRERPTRPLCAITFDDGLRSIDTDAWPMLKARGLPASVFLNTSVIGNGSLLWQHALSYAIAREGITDGARIAAAVRQFGPTFHAEAIATRSGFDLATVAAAERPYLTWPRIDRMAAEGLRFYSHTASHYPLANVSPDVMAREIADARAALRPSARTALVSFPFGMVEQFGAAARAIALTQHAYVLEVEDGVNPVRRVARSRTVRRVCLGHATADAQQYAALELQPAIKGALNTLRRH